MDKKKILIVDDEPQFVKVLKVRLEANGFAAVEAYDGEEGLVKAQEELPDLILLDIMMPKKDGFSMLRDLKKDDATKNIPVIVITAKPDMKELFEPEGVKDYIIKPYVSEDLIPMVNRALGVE